MRNQQEQSVDAVLLAVLAFKRIANFTLSGTIKLMSKFDDEFCSPPRRNKHDPITGKALPSNAVAKLSSQVDSALGHTQWPVSSQKPHSTARTKSRQDSSSSSSISTSNTGFSRSSEQGDRINHRKRRLVTNSQEHQADSAESEANSFKQQSVRTGKTLLMRGIDYLSRREHSAYELRRKLAPYAESEEELESTLQRLQKENWQNDERFMRNFSQAKQAKWGSAKVLHALTGHKLEAENLEELREQLRETEYDRALEVYQRKFRTPLNAAADFQREYAKRVRFMMSRGFDAEVVRKMLKTPAQEEE